MPQTSCGRQAFLRPLAQASDVPKAERQPGVLVVRTAAGYTALWFYQEKGLNIEHFVALIEEHPLLAVGSWEKEKTTGQWKNSKWCPEDHLSARNYGMRTRLNFSAVVGYTKHGDDRPGAPGRQGRPEDHLYWRAYKEEPNTMCIPLLSAVGDNLSAVGDNEVLVRTVSCLNFPALCILGAAQYTATELETAWLLMPVVRTRKPAHHRKTPRAEKSSSGRWRSGWR